MVYEPKAENKRGTILVMGWDDDAQMEDSEASKKRGNGSVGKQGGGKELKADVLGAQDQAQYSPTVIQIHERTLFSSFWSGMCGKQLRACTQPGKC